MRKIRTATPDDVHKVAIACKMLREAHKLLREAGAPRAAARTLSAIKSAAGAQRHAWHRYDHAQIRTVEGGL